MIFLITLFTVLSVLSIFILLIACVFGLFNHFSKDKVSIQAIFIISALCAFTILFALSGLLNYKIDENYLFYLQLIAIPFIVYLLLLSVRIIWKLEFLVCCFPRIDKHIEGSLLKKVWLTISSLLLMIAPYMAITKGVPTFLHLIFVKPGTSEVVVKGKKNSFNDRRCLGGIYYEDGLELVNRRLCGLNKEDWERARRGDVILLKGKKSLMAFEVKEYILLRKR